MSNAIARQRTIIRWIHFVGGACVATAMYAPWGAEGPFRLLNQAVVLPALIASGLWLWKGHLLRRKASAQRGSKA
jgi:hypothetical protein